MYCRPVCVIQRLCSVLVHMVLLRRCQQFFEEEAEASSGDSSGRDEEGCDGDTDLSGFIAAESATPSTVATSVARYVLCLSPNLQSNCAQYSWLWLMIG